VARGAAAGPGILRKMSATGGRPGGRPVLIYDGDCGFCQAAVRFARRRIDPALRAQAFQRTDLGALGLTEQQAAREVLWAGADGRVSGGARAVARLLTDAGGRWALAGALLRIPPLSWLAEAAYRLIAANRHRLPGGTPRCDPGARPAGRGEDQDRDRQASRPGPPG
jgi:predicted DCC family thiol-disulfide oxidoreductase YuxK